MGKVFLNMKLLFQLLPNTTCTSEKGGPIQNQCVVTSVFRSTRGKSITVGMKIMLIMHFIETSKVCFTNVKLSILY